jgi:hypothetical protein
MEKNYRTEIEEIEERLKELTYELPPRRKRFVRDDLYYKITDYLNDRESRESRL